MKLIKCYIENFGKLHNFKYEFQEDLNIINEENGFGKTTFATFIKSMFYGLDAGVNVKTENSERKKYMPWQGGMYGGNIEFKINNKQYRIERFFGKKQSEDTFKLYDINTNLESTDYTENIGEEIFKINKSAYERSTYIPQGKIQIDMEDSLSAKLGNVLESDNDINTSEEALKRLNNSKKLYKKDKGTGGLIDEKKEKLLRLERELENSKSDVENLEIKKRRLDDKLKQLNEIEILRKDADDLLSKKIEQDRKIAKQETYKTILTRYHQLEDKIEELENFLNGGIVEKFENKKITEETIDEALKSCYKLPEIEKDIKQEEDKRENISKKIKTNRLISSILLFLGIFTLILGITLIATNLQKIIGIVGIVIGAILIGISCINLYKRKSNDLIEINRRIQQLVEDRQQIEEQLGTLVSNFTTADKEIVELTNLKSEYNMLQIKKNEYFATKKQYEFAQEEKARFENENNIEELQKVEDLSNISEAELREKIFEINKNIDTLSDEKNQLKNDIELLENKIDDNEFLESDIEKLKEEIESCKEKYKILVRAEELLKSAKTSFSSSYLQEMIDGFNKYIKIINQQDMNTSVDIKLGVKVDTNGAQKEIKYFSYGYQDLIYICMRFSLIQALFKTESPFVVLDDPFVNLDDEKTKKALEILNEFSKKIQIIYFVCNSSRV